ncbi:cyclin-Q-like [Dysidea avara]|uniref:cyclin-Q-like n=1 Tax=Dysidea avara TaxID=196820 RepID=UPI00331865F0
MDSMVVHFIREAGWKLKLRETATSTALVFYHKFKSAFTLEVNENTDHHLIAMAALYLASKTNEETHLKLSDIVNTCYRCLHKDKPPLEIGDMYWKLKDSVAAYELVLLRALKFQTEIILPHKYLLHYFLVISYWETEKLYTWNQVRQLAWCFLQDLFHTTLCVRHSPQLLATTVLYLAMACHGMQVEGRRMRRQWWEVFSPGCSEETLKEIGVELLSLYDDNTKHKQ